VLANIHPDVRLPICAGGRWDHVPETSNGRCSYHRVSASSGGPLRAERNGVRSSSCSVHDAGEAKKLAGRAGAAEWRTRSMMSVDGRGALLWPIGVA
jgi:hypothetical protein